MGTAWTRCRRCARRLTNSTSARDGIGPECSDKEAPAKLPLRCKLMDACDVIEKGIKLIPLEAERVFHERRLRVARDLIESEDRVPKSIERHVLGTASYIQNLERKTA